MADISHHQFVALLKKSKVVEPKKLQPWLQKTKKIENARKLAKSLVQNELLTTWQAKFLLSGRYRLRIGNYFLLSRLRRDELGARYLAVHASLKRKVELQIFARDLTSDTQRWKDMIQKASLVAKLDHPALVHVYDIDHDDDRYFLVVEHVAGRSLDVQKEIFTTPQIGKLILQCAEGIEVAHQNNVVHGTIDQADILLTDKGTVKLQNLTVSPIRNLNSGEPEAEPIADYLALAALGKKILQANPGADGGEGVGLSAIFELMKSDGPGAIKKLEQWVEASPDAAISPAAVTKSGASPIFSPSPGSRSGVDPSKTTSSSVGIGDSNDVAAATSSASIIQAAWASRPFLIALAVGMLMFCGIVIFGLSRAYDKFIAQPAVQATEVATKKEDLEEKKRAEYNAREKKAVEAQQAKENPAGNDAKGPQDKDPKKASNPAAGQRNKNKNRKKARQNQRNKKDAGNSNGDQAEPDVPNPSKAEIETPSVVGPDETATSAEPEASQMADAEPAVPNKFMDIFNKRTDTSAKPDEKTAGAKKPANKDGIPEIVTDPDNLKALKGIGPATEKTLYKAGVQTYAQIVKMTPDQLDKVLEQGNGQKLGKKAWNAIIEEAKPLADVALSNAANPFRKVPNIFELPAVESTQPIKLTELLIPANYTLTTELVSPEGISPRSILFELDQQSSAEGQVWTVSSKRSKKSSKSTPVAKFTKTFDALSFAWLPEAAKDKSAVYLRNCLLRLSTPDGLSSVSKLRKPQTVRTLRLNADNLSDTVKFEIEGAPDPNKMEIQLVGFRNRRIQILDPVCNFKSPAVVALLPRDENGPVKLQVSAARAGKAIKLSAGFVLNGVPIKSKDQLVAIESQLNGLVTQAAQRLRTDPKSRALQKELRNAATNHERMKFYLESMKWFFDGGGGIGEPIDFDVSVDFGDGRLVLLKSDKNIENKDRKKKK